MNDSSEKEVQSLLSGLDDESVDKETKELSSAIDSKELLRDDLFSFLRTRMNRIEAAEKFRMKIQEELEAQLERGELSYDQIVALFSMVNRQIRDNTDSIMTILKPVPGANSPLTETISHQEKGDKIQEFFDSANPETLKAFDALFRKMKSVGKDTSSDIEDVEVEEDLPDSLFDE